MTPLLLALVVIQAALLLWSSVSLSDIFLLPNKGAALARFAGTFALPVAIAWFGRSLDLNRLLCGYVDCLALVVSVGFVRIWAVNKETERYLVEQQLAAEAAREAVEAARKEYEEERIRSAAAALEASRARDARKEADAASHRQNTTPLLRGGARSPRQPGQSRPQP